MNELLQKHGCSNVFSIPEGLKELMADISREVLRAQPRKILEFITKYLSALLITREHGIMAVKILDELCDCRPTVSEHLLELGMDQQQAETLAGIIKTEIEREKDSNEEEESVREYVILKNMLAKVPMDEDMSAKICQVVRNAYRDYWYRKSLLKEGLKWKDEEPWQIAARHTLELYKRTKPSMAQLNRATERIQAAYKGYHIRRHVLRHLLPKKDKREGRKVNLAGPPIDVENSRAVDLGPVLDIRHIVKEDNVNKMFEKEATASLGLNYDPTKTITHTEDDIFLQEQEARSMEQNTVKSSDAVEDEIQPSKGYADETPFVDKSALLAAEEEEQRRESYEKSEPRISFTSDPPEVIEDFEESQEIPEEPQADYQSQTTVAVEDVFEVPEDIQADFDETTGSFELSAIETSDLEDGYEEDEQ